MTNLIPLISYSDIEDRRHKLDGPDYYEWWYSDFRFENGWTAVAVWHYSDWLKKPRVPSVEISIYDPDGNRYYEETVLKPGDAKASEEKCDVTIGKHHFWQDGNHYRLIVDSKKAGADLTMTAAAPPFFIAPGAIYSEGKDEHFWCIPVPRGVAEGKLYVDGQEMKVTGICYHDHNWGSCDMNRNFGGWTWGRFFDDEYSGIFSYSFPIHIASSPEPQVNSQTGILYLAKKDKLILCTEKIQVTTEEEVFDELTGQTVGSKVILKASEDNCQAKCEFTLQNIVERDHLKFAGWNTHNWRFLDTYNTEIVLDGKKDKTSGKMLHEKFLLRLK
ncbi:MAG: hypothetical protein EHM12_05550 [Dehalococcoidia bacterium]|nr:MAG: hypothetical protein EHM12_05550 [Dehalococcoidia bacterium]